MKANTREFALRIRQNINSVDPEAEVILYGSRARGDERSESDWDVLVLTQYDVDLQAERRFRNNLYDLELESGEAVSLFVYSKNDWQTRQRISPFYQSVTHEGIRI